MCVDHGLCLSSNQVDPSFHAGAIDGSPMLPSRATNDLLVSASKTACLKILTTSKGASWKIHEKGLARFFFGICICQFGYGAAIDQAHHATEIIASVLSKDWTACLKSEVKHLIPLPAGTEHQAVLVTLTPFD